MVASEPVERECTKTRVETRYGSLITRMKLKDPTKLGKLDVENEILCIMKLKPKLDREIERNAEDLMQPAWVKACNDEHQQILDEYIKNRQENSTDALKRKLYIAQQQRDEALEELSDLQVKHENLFRFIEEKSKKIHATDLSNVQNDKDLVDLVVDTLHQIISFNKELKSEDERDDDEQEEEEGEKSGKGGDEEEGKKGGDIHDDSDEDDEEEGGNGGNLHDDDNDKEGSKGGDDEDRTESNS
ncbi:digestive organ expansion factor homolog [Papaver somniferum]|uniref:digestive organ expansion factor homolog n=1 Tax=Papaver somniferum TaxID=3469 RepID=UPI000E6FB1B9|nr:digestive organ expansion factor homolog [Papaver somniferum]